MLKGMEETHILMHLYKYKKELKYVRYCWSMIVPSLISCSPIPSHSLSETSRNNLKESTIIDPIVNTSVKVPASATGDW